MLLVALALAASLHNDPCSWAHPGADPYRKDPVLALNDYSLDSKTKADLQSKMKAHKFDAMVTISRDRIGGQGLEAEYTNLRDMHSGHKTCHGPVDRSAWSPTQTERGLVYCSSDVCVIVPTVCNNVSLVDRKKEEQPADESEILIEPAAGIPTPPILSLAPVVDHSFASTVEVPDSGQSPGPSGGQYSPPDFGSGGGPDIIGVVPKVPKPPASAPSNPCAGSDCGPFEHGHPTPPPPPPVRAIPEPSNLVLLLIGLCTIAVVNRYRLTKTVKT
jgi:hypothetical protein